MAIGCFETRSSRINAVLGGVLASAATLSYAAPAPLPELLVALSTARGEAVGRASRVQACQQLRNQKVVTQLVLKYDDARTSHNARIEAWVFALKGKLLSLPDVAGESQQLNTSRLKVTEFTSAASAALTKAGCGSKVFWQPLLIALAPVAVDKLVDYFKELAKDDKAVQEAIQELEFYKMPPWESAGAVVVYDWNSEQYLAEGKFTAADLKKGSTGIYVNKWTLVKEPNSLFVRYKEVPPALSGAYLLYTGPLDALKDFTTIKSKFPSPQK
jgi:hypothetical protein